MFLSLEGTGHRLKANLTTFSFEVLVLFRRSKSQPNLNIECFLNKRVFKESEIIAAVTGFNQSRGLH